jgi:hypothetical protein
MVCSSLIIQTKKKMKHIISAFSILIIVLVFVGCKKNEQRLITTTGTDGKALIKINYAMPFALNPSVQLKLNGERISNLITYNTPFPAGGLNTGGGNYQDYMAVDAGTTTLTISRPNVGTNNDSIVLFTGPINLEAGKNITYHVTDTGANTTIVAVTDNISPIDSGFSRYVFVNLMPNLPALDLYYGTTKVASNIAYKAKSPEFTIAAATASSWAIRPAGAASTTTALASYTNTIPNQRVFTVYARGYSGVTGTRAPAVSLLYNR